MRYRSVGRWGVEVSEVGLGSWLTYGGSVEADAATACIRRAYELGVNFFDTANVYSAGRAEEVMGAALADYRRESYVLATKVYFPMSRRPNSSGLSRKHIMEQLHASLRRLGTDTIDIYQCHRYDEKTPLEETCAAMADAIRSGKVHYWGVSEWTADQIAHAVTLCRSEGWPVPISNQPQYSMLWREIEKRVLPVSGELGLGQVVWSPLAQGVLTGKYATPDDIPEDSRAAGGDKDMVTWLLEPEVLDAVQALRPLAEEAGCTLPQLALKWALREPGISSVIVGATKVEHVDDNVAASDLDVPDELLQRAGDLLESVTRG
ncbi:MAG: aldo/keto reductase family protein [Acidimicrobiia bacterium]